MAQAQKTGRCPFCGASLPPRTFYSWRYGLPVGRGYATTCPQCGQSSFPRSLQLAIFLGTFVYAAIVVVLGLLAGWTAAGLVLFGTLLLVMIPILIYVVSQGQAFNAVCILIGLGIAGYTWVWPAVESVTAPRYSVRVTSSMPGTARLSHALSASVVIRNEGGTIPNLSLDLGDYNAASSGDSGLSEADWTLKQITADGHKVPLNEYDNYEFGRLLPGRAMRLSFLIAPRDTGKHRFQFEISRDAEWTSNDSHKIRVVALGPCRISR